MPNMKAVRIHNYGPADVLAYEDAPRPMPGAGEVLIRVHATTVNPFDVAVRAGYMSAYIQYSLPIILGTDVSGVIEQVGPNVTGWKQGDAVYTRAGVMRDGAYAEYVVVPASDVAPKPVMLDHLHAAAIPHVTLTAWQALYEAANVSRGQTVLIHGAGGGVGHMAVQLAKLRGAKVIGTTSRHKDLVRDLGADEIIDYSTTRFEDVVHDADVVLDIVGGDTQERSWQVLKPGGMLISTIQAPSEQVAQARGVRAYFVATNPPIGPTLAEVGRLVDAGKLKPIVSQVLPLEQIRKAHGYVETQHMGGKLALEVCCN